MRAWPLLALLLLVISAGIGCVLWFMREAVENEHAAVRQRFADAYRGHLQLLQPTVEAQFLSLATSLDSIPATPESFAQQVKRGEIESLILLAPDGNPIYPTQTRTHSISNDASVESGPQAEAEAVQAQVRELIHAGDLAAAAHLVSERFSDADLGRILDANGRVIAANAELMVLEAIAARRLPADTLLANRLKERLADYRSNLSSPQRRFLMREFQRLYPALTAAFPTWPAENLAVRYMESAAPLPSPLILERTPLPNVWHVLSPKRCAVAFLSTAQVHGFLRQAVAQHPAPEGVNFRLLAPFEDEPAISPALVTVPVGRHLPGWKLALFLDDQGLFETTANRRVTRYLWTATLVIVTMSILAMVIARSFAKQLQLTRLRNDLVATISHELKTPLTSMRVLVDTLLETEKFHEPTVREYLQLLSQENTRLSRLIDNVLTFSRLERNKLTFTFVETPPEAVVSDTVAALGDRFRSHGCDFQLITEPGLPLIRADRDALATALLNLLDNAWKYSGDQKEIILRTKAHNGSVLFTVADNGIGLAKRETRKVFQRFYQVDHDLSRSTGGCGLGLSIVDQIVTAHGGEVHVTSEPRKGSAFTLEIPAVSNSSETTW